MTKVAILPIPAEQGALSYRAIAGEKHAQGKTAGEALDALTAQLSADEASTLVIVQSLRPDRFFIAAQQERLTALSHRIFRLLSSEIGCAENHGKTLSGSGASGCG